MFMSVRAKKRWSGVGDVVDVDNSTDDNALVGWVSVSAFSLAVIEDVEDKWEDDRDRSSLYMRANEAFPRVRASSKSPVASGVLPHCSRICPILLRQASIIKSGLMEGVEDAKEMASSKNCTAESSLPQE